MTIARDKYEGTEVGSAATLCPGHSESREAFQSTYQELLRMEDDGLIKIIKAHKESDSGQRMVDLVIFERLS